MKVLFLTPWYPDEKNLHHGIFVRDQAVAVSKSHEVELISSKIDYTSFSIFSFSVSKSNFNGVNEHRIVVKKSLPVINQLVYFLITIRQTVLITRKFSPDIIHGNIGYPGAFWSWAVSKILKRPFVFTEHASHFKNYFRSIFHKWLTVYFLKKSQVIISVSKYSADEVFSFIGKRPIVIPNIIDFDRFNELATRVNPVVQIGFLGGLATNSKGLDVLLKAMAGCKTPFMLHVGGDGKLLNEYKTLAVQLGIEKKCIFYNFLQPHQVPAFLKRLHFFVSSSRFESFGMAIVEAMACGLPVIATDSGGPSDFIRLFNGKLIPKENVTELQHAIEFMMGHHQDYSAEEIRKFALENYSAEIFTREINKVYTSLKR